MDVICVLGALVLATHRCGVNLKCIQDKYRLFLAHIKVGTRFEATFFLSVPRIGTRRDGTTLNYCAKVSSGAIIFTVHPLCDWLKA